MRRERDDRHLHPVRNRQRAEQRIELGSAVGLYAASSQAELDALLGALPLADWMQMTVIPLTPHPNDPERDAR